MTTKLNYLDGNFWSFQGKFKFTFYLGQIFDLFKSHDDDEQEAQIYLIQLI